MGFHRDVAESSQSMRLAVPRVGRSPRLSTQECNAA